MLFESDLFAVVFVTSETLQHGYSGNFVYLRSTTVNVWLITAHNRFAQPHAPLQTLKYSREV